MYNLFSSFSNFTVPRRRIRSYSAFLERQSILSFLACFLVSLSVPFCLASMEEKQKEKVSAPILETFWALADISPAKRVQAAKELIISLRGVEDQSADSQEMNYCLKRLVRGLASSREGARQGFAMALTEVSFPSLLSILFLKSIRYCIHSPLFRFPLSWI